MEYHIYAIGIIVIAHCVTTMVQSHVCVLQQRPHRSGDMRLSLPLSEICLCKMVVAPTKIVTTCPTGEEAYLENDLWFLLEGEDNFKRRVWRGNLLEELLDRSAYCTSSEVSVEEITSTKHLTSTQATTSVVSTEITSRKQATSSQATPFVVSTGKVMSTKQTTCTQATCNDPLGMENGDIPAANIQASTERYPCEDGRLNGAGCWGAQPFDNNPWIQVDIGYETHVSGVITQGDGGAGSTYDWVTSFKVSTFIDWADETFVEVDGQEVIFPGNTDINTAVTAAFPQQVYARIVRIYCVSSKYYGYPQLRFEILGCKLYSDTRI